jgi:hypothetical protein
MGEVSRKSSKTSSFAPTSEDSEAFSVAIQRVAHSSFDLDRQSYEITAMSSNLV